MTDEKPKTSDHVVTTFGRFNPPSVGHKHLLDTIKAHAEKHAADHLIYASPTQDAKKNPLHHKDKVSIMNKMFPGTNIHGHDDVRNIIDAAKHLHSKGYKKATFFVGSDRQQEMSNLLHKYNGKEYKFDHIEVKSAGERDDKAKGVAGASGTKLREYVKKGDFKNFQKGAGSKEHAKELFNMVKKGMKLENYKAMFVFGNVGSGKNVLITPLLEKFNNLHEINIANIMNAIKGGELTVEAGAPILINASAENLEDISIAKTVLESIGYQTAAAFVWTTDDESKLRNDARIAAGERTITESRRVEKYQASIKNVDFFARIFEGFLLFNNSADVNELTEAQRGDFELYLSDALLVLESFVSKTLEESEASVFVKNFVEGARNEFDAHKHLSSHAAVVKKEREKKNVNLGAHNFFDYQAKRDTKPAPKPLKKEETEKKPSKATKPDGTELDTAIATGAQLFGLKTEGKSLGALRSSLASKSPDDDFGG